MKHPGIIPACLLLVAAAGCAPTQRVPGPLFSPEPPPVDFAPASLQAIVVRHAGPVWVFRPGATEGYALPYHRKRERVDAGGGVRVGRGGRAELFWPGTASSAVLFENGRASFGDRDRNEPLLAFTGLTRVQLFLTPVDRVGLPGGAELRGDPTGTSGPFLVEHVGEELLRVTNQSRGRARIHCGEDVLELAAGNKIILPIVGRGSNPTNRDPARTELLVGGIALGIVGRVTPSEPGGALRLVAQEASRVEARGVEVRLEARQEAVFSGLGPAGGGKGGSP